jgi:hypothetical protein
VVGWVRIRGNEDPLDPRSGLREKEDRLVKQRGISDEFVVCYKVYTVQEQCFTLSLLFQSATASVSGWTIENGCGVPGVKFGQVITSVRGADKAPRFRLTTTSPPPQLSEMRIEFPQFDVSVAADDEQFGADHGE